MGHLAPRHSFVLNPYTDARFTTCSQCGARTKLRKVPLVIHVPEVGLVLLRKSCRLCTACDLLIAHRAEVDAQIQDLLPPRSQGIPDYVVLGTVDVRFWRSGLQTQRPVADLRERMADFRSYLTIRREASQGIPPGGRSA